MAIEIEIGGVLAGYRIERLLGSGAMGAVYLSEDIHLQRKVAVKVLAPELAADERFRKRFLVESQLAASLDHPNIVPIYRAGEEGGLLYLAMRYVEGYDLRELVDSTRGGLDPARGVRWGGPPPDAPRRSSRLSGPSCHRRSTRSCRRRSRRSPTSATRRAPSSSPTPRRLSRLGHRPRRLSSGARSQAFARS